LGKELSEKEKELHRLTREVYEERIANGIAREQARKDLPLSTYTEAYWKIDLHNLFHFLFLRMDEHAQFEIRQYAKIIGYEIVSKWVPIAWEAFLDYRVNSLQLTGPEREIISAIISGDNEVVVKKAATFGWLKESGEMKRNREREEFEEKLLRLGMKTPW
jgi:thymidylate synthase (FAD)